MEGRAGDKVSTSGGKEVETTGSQQEQGGRRRMGCGLVGGRRGEGARRLLIESEHTFPDGSTKAGAASRPESGSLSHRVGIMFRLPALVASRKPDEGKRRNITCEPGDCVLCRYVQCQLFLVSFQC